MTPQGNLVYDLDFTVGAREFLGDKGLNKGNKGAANVKPVGRTDELFNAGINSKGRANIHSVTTHHAPENAARTRELERPSRHFYRPSFACVDACHFSLQVRLSSKSFDSDAAAVAAGVC